jgi:hypothetical protein
MALMSSGVVLILSSCLHSSSSWSVGSSSVMLLCPGYGIVYHLELLIISIVLYRSI